MMISDAGLIRSLSVGHCQILIEFAGPVRRSLRRSDEDPFAWKFFDQRLRLAEVGSKHVKRIARDPHREIDGFVMACVETDQDAAVLAADVLDGMAIALRDVADIALVQRLDPGAAVGTKQRDADLPFNYVLPLG